MTNKLLSATMTSTIALTSLLLLQVPAQAMCTKVGVIVTCAANDADGYADATNLIDLTVNNMIFVDSNAGQASISLTGNNVKVLNNGSISTVGTLGTDGVFANGSAEIKNNGVITARRDGISVLALVTSTSQITNNGTISVIAGGGDGIRIDKHVNTTIRNTGTVDSAGQYGVHVLNSSGTNINNSSIIKGNQAGINIANLAGQATTVLNTGTITGTLSIKGGDGNETINNFGTLNGNVDLGLGLDNVSNSGTVKGSVLTGGGNDIVSNSGTIDNSIETGAGDDQVFILSGGKVNSILTGDDNDRVDINNGGLAVILNTGSGIDTVTIGGELGNLSTDSGDDVITVTTTGKISLASFAGAGNDRLTNDGQILFTFDMGDGDDTVINNGLINRIDLGNGKNTLTNTGFGMNGIKVLLTGGTGDDTIINNGDIAAAINLGNGNNRIENNGNVSGAITLGSGADVIDNYVLLAGPVDTGAGDDTITNFSGANINGSITTGAGSDRINSNVGSTISGAIGTGTGDDIIFHRGAITGNVSLGDDNDALIMFDGMSLGLTTVIDGGNGNDRLTLAQDVFAVKTNVLTNQIDNIESLRVMPVTGARWVLGRNYTFATTTSVEGGALEIANGFTLTSAAVSVENGGLLTGEGRIVGNVTVRDVGILRPGNGTTTTMNVAGNVTVNAFGRVEVGVGPGVVQSKLEITGDLNLNGNGTLQVSVAPGLYKATTRYDVITLGGTRAGEFGTVNLPTGTRFTKFKVNYLPKAVQVEVEKLNYNTVGKTYNQREAGDGLYRGMEGSVAGSDMEAVAGAFEGLPNDEAMQRALDSLSGVEWASMGEVRGGVSRSFRDAGMGRVGVMSEGMGVWGQLLQGRNDVDGDGNGAGIKGEVQGLVGGMEYGFGVGKVGVMVGYGDGKMRLSGMGEGKVEMMMGGVYGGWSFGGIEVEGGLSYGEGKQRVERQIGVGGVQRRVEGGEKVREFGGNVGIGYGIKLGMIEITPSLGFEVVRYEEKGFKENGGGDVGLVGGKERGWRGQGEVGVKVGGVFQAGAVTFSPYVHGGYERVVMGKGYMDRDVAFVGNENGTGFNVRGTDGGKEQFKAGAGINVGFGPVVLELGYEQSVGGKRDNQMFQGGLSVRW